MENKSWTYIKHLKNICRLVQYIKLGETVKDRKLINNYTVTNSDGKIKKKTQTRETKIKEPQKKGLKDTMNLQKS